MEEIEKIDLRQIEDLVKSEENGMEKKKENKEHKEMDNGSALQLYFDRIPITEIPFLKNSPVLELKTGDSIKDAIEHLYEKNESWAPILDLTQPTDTTISRFSDKYIGLISFSTMLLWCLEKIDKVPIKLKGNGSDKMGQFGFFTLLEQNPGVGHTKVGDLAKSFLWDPFFPVRLDETLFHVLLLLSKHPVNVVPVTEKPDSQVIGLITQNAVNELLLKSDGLEWFDNIANKSLSEFRFEHDRVTQVYGDECIAEVFCIMLKTQSGVVAVIDRKTQKLIGGIRQTDVHLILKNDNLLHTRSVTVEEFIHAEQTGKTMSDTTTERSNRDLYAGGVPSLKDRVFRGMDSPVTSKRTDSLKQTMKLVAETKCSFSFLVDDMQRPTGVLTLRDILVQFAPPGLDSGIHGGSFFETALEQSGCCVKNGAIVCD